MQIEVGVLGATGVVGQKLVELLENHPWFKLCYLGASERSVGKRYADCVEWKGNKNLSPLLAEHLISPCVPFSLSSPFWMFSALDGAVAGEIESAFARSGFIVFSNAKNHRMSASVPLMIPEVNGEHLVLLEDKKEQIITNPNCLVSGLALVLKPLLDFWGISSVHVTTLQSISGAGYPGVASLDILDNVIPFIEGEEEKIETEPLKILGTLFEKKIHPPDVKISAQCNRVPVIEGHMGCVSIKLKKEAQSSELIEAWNSFSHPIVSSCLPSAPQHSIVYTQEQKYPQPKLHKNLGNGMTVSVGQLRKCSLLDWKFIFLVHNTIRGAAGGALLNAEWYFWNNFIKKSGLGIDNILLNPIK